MKFCKDCRFCDMGDGSGDPICRGVLHPVTGEPRGMKCEMARILRPDQGGCGIEAMLFKDAPTVLNG